jgi:2-polyprenyl-6-methoxyphenol hydroxylase-like FAD-dependent oxidoreductase
MSERATCVVVGGGPAERWDLLNLLAEAGRDEPSFSLRMRTQMTDLIRDPDGVKGVRYRTQDGDSGEIRADLTLACDGRDSTARRQAGLQRKDFPTSIDVWWFRLPRRPEDAPSALTPRAGPGRFALVIPRDRFLQIAYVGPKGTDRQLRARGIERFRQDVAELVPEFRARVDALGSMDDVKHLDVHVDRLRRWHVDGLLCIGDAAHAMSPVGGVGINLAVQDAVAAATRLAGPLRRGTVTQADLAAVRRRRVLPTVATQALQRLLHHGLVAPIIEGGEGGRPGGGWPSCAVFRRCPWRRRTSSASDRGPSMRRTSPGDPLAPTPTDTCGRCPQAGTCWRVAAVFQRRPGADRRPASRPMGRTSGRTSYR